MTAKAPAGASRRLAQGDPPGHPYKDTLPTGWRWVRLGEVMKEAQGGFACGERYPKGVIQLRMNNVTIQGTLDWSSFIRVPATEDQIREYCLERGDVLFNNTNSTELVGKSALFQEHDEPIVFSNHFTRLKTKADLLDSEFLSRWLLQQWQQKVFENLCNRWIGQSAVQRDKLLALEMPLPPLPEQRRISGILREQLGAVEKARAAAEAQLEAAQALPSAYLREVFPKLRQPLPRGWKCVKLGELCKISARQVDPKLPEYSGLPHVSAEDIESGTGRLFDLKSAAEDGMISGKYIFESGCILYSKIRPYLRKAVVAPCRGLCSADMYPIDVKHDSFDANYFLWLLLSEAFTEWADSESRRARMPKLNRDQLFSYLAPLPPLIEQQRIAASLNNSFAKADALRSQLSALNSELSALPQSLLRKAFRGEL